MFLDYLILKYYEMYIQVCNSHYIFLEYKFVLHIIFWI